MELEMTMPDEISHTQKDERHILSYLWMSVQGIKMMWLSYHLAYTYVVYPSCEHVTNHSLCDISYLFSWQMNFYTKEQSIQCWNANSEMPFLNLSWAVKLLWHRTQSVQGKSLWPESNEECTFRISHNLSNKIQWQDVVHVAPQLWSSFMLHTKNTN